MTMTANSTVRVPTTKASRYLQQLCKHFSHHLAVEFTEEKGGVVFPRNARGADWPDDAILLMQAHDDSLECRLEASASGQLEALKGVPFDKYRFGAMAIEHNDEEPKRSDLLKFLEEKGYQRVHSFRQDDFYAPRK